MTSKKWLTLSLLMMGVLALVIRFADLSTQFTHVDDIGVAHSIFKAQAVRDVAAFEARYYDPKHDRYNSADFKAMRWLDHHGLRSVIHTSFTPDT